jgi:hypothetical protein
MNDDDMLAATRSSLTSVKDSLTDVHMNERPEAIMARARGRRMRRGLPVAGAGGLALGVGLALALSGGSPAAPGGSLASPGGSLAAPGGSPGARAVHVNLAAWSVNTTSDGLVNVTIRELKDPAGLGKTLADAGVPVKVTSGRVCASADEARLPQVVRKLPGTGDVVLTINPKAMPAGTELVIGIGRFGSGPHRGMIAAAFGLTKQGVPLDCHGTKAGAGSGGVQLGARWRPISARRAAGPVPPPAQRARPAALSWCSVQPRPAGSSGRVSAVKISAARR